MKINSYNTGDYIVDTFNNIMKLGNRITLPSDQEGYETDFIIGHTSQNISVDSIDRKCTLNEIKEYKEKYG